MDEEGIIPEELERNIEGHLSSQSKEINEIKPYCAMLYLIPTFHNPTGVSLAPGMLILYLLNYYIKLHSCVHLCLCVYVCDYAYRCVTIRTLKNILKLCMHIYMCVNAYIIIKMFFKG